MDTHGRVDSAAAEQPVAPGTDAAPGDETVGEELSGAFEQQALSHMDALYRTALRMTRNPQDAEDLVQETYLKAFRFAASYRRDTNLRAWLFKILSTSAINRYTKAAHTPPSDSLDTTDETTLYQGLKALGGRFEQGAEDEALSKLVGDEVRRALDALPAQFRMAVLLADVEGFSYREIADITGVRIGTVMSRISRGRKLLQKALWHYARESGLIPAGVAEQGEQRATSLAGRPALGPAL